MGKQPKGRGGGNNQKKPKKMEKVGKAGKPKTAVKVTKRLHGDARPLKKVIKVKSCPLPPLRPLRHYALKILLQASILSTLSIFLFFLVAFRSW